MCRNFFPGISGGVLTPLTPPLDPPLHWHVAGRGICHLWLPCSYCFQDSFGEIVTNFKTVPLSLFNPQNLFRSEQAIRSLNYTPCGIILGIKKHCLYMMYQWHVCYHVRGVNQYKWTVHVCGGTLYPMRGDNITYSTNHVYLHRPNAFGFWQTRLHLCYETLKRVSNFSELA